MIVKFQKKGLSQTDLPNRDGVRAPSSGFMHSADQQDDGANKNPAKDTALTWPAQRLIISPG